MKALHRTRGSSLPLLLPMACLAAACAETAAPEPVLLEIRAGNGQVARVGTPIAAPLVVNVMGLDSLPHEAVPVEWTILQGRGTIEPSAASSDAEGRAEASWILGPQVGQQLVQAMAGGESVEFEAWANPPPPEDWSEVIEMRLTAEVEGDNLHTSIRLHNHWAGILQMKTMTGCFMDWAALYAGDERVAQSGFFCTYAERMWRVPPADSLGFGWSFNVASVAPGDYAVRWRPAVVEIDGAPGTLPDVETHVSLGG